MYNSELCTCVVISVHPGSNGAVTSAMLLQCLLIWARFHLPSSDAFLILLLSAICSFSQTLQGASFLQFAVCPWLGHYLGRGFRRRGESLPWPAEARVLSHANLLREPLDSRGGWFSLQGLCLFLLVRCSSYWSDPKRVLSENIFLMSICFAMCCIYLQTKK